MIVVDTNLIAYFFLHAEYSDLVEKAFQKDPQWAAPLLWRSELRNVLVKCLKDEYFSFEIAVQIMNGAEELMRSEEYAVNSFDVLKIASTAGCSSYDAEFVVLARELGVPLVTMDSKILKAFPEIAVPLNRFVSD